MALQGHSIVPRAVRGAHGNVCDVRRGERILDPGNRSRIIIVEHGCASTIPDYFPP